MKVEESKVAKKYVAVEEICDDDENIRLKDGSWMVYDIVLGDYLPLKQISYFLASELLVFQYFSISAIVIILINMTITFILCQIKLYCRIFIVKLKIFTVNLGLPLKPRYRNP